MYKNFNISESEKEQILNRLRENGYGQPINEQKTPSPSNGQVGIPQPPSKPTGSKYKVDPKLSIPENIKNAERTLGRPLNPPEVSRLVDYIKHLKSRTPKNTTRTVDNVTKNDVTGDNKGEGVNLYTDNAQTILKYSATIDKILKSGSGFDIYVSGDYEFTDKYFHWEPKSSYFQAFVKSTRKPLTWDYKGKMRNEIVYNKEFSSVLQNMVVPTSSSAPTNDDIDFVSGNVNEQTDPSKYGTAVDDMNIIKEKIMGKPVRFFMDKELKTPAYNGSNFTFSKVEKDGSDSTKFNIYFKEFSDPVTFKCGFKDFFYRSSKRESLFNTTLYKYLTTALCNTELSNDGKLKSVPNVKYAKNDTQGAPNQTDTLAENKKVIRLTESDLRKHIQKIILEQNTELPLGAMVTPPVSDEQQKEDNVTLVKELIRQLTSMKFTPKGDNRYVGTFNDDIIEVLFSDESVTVSKRPIKPKKFVDQNGKEHGMGLLESPLVLTYNRIDPRTFMKQLVGYINKGTRPKGDIPEQINPDYSKGTHDIDARGEKYLPLAQKLAKQLKQMKFTFNGKNIFTNTFDGYHVTVEFNNQGVQISKVLEKKVDTPNMQAPLVLPYEKLNEMDFMKHIVDYVHGTKQPINEQGYIDGPGQECYRYGEIFVCVNDKSDDVEKLQKDLNQSACQKGLPPIQVDGVFGPKTKERIMINQKSKCKLPFDFNTQQYRRVKTETGERYVPVKVSGTNLG